MKGHTIGFLRGINVGGHTVKMDVLKTHIAELGLEDVSTFIASGNVIFATPHGNLATLETRIAAHLRQRLGFDVATYLRTDAELAKIVSYEPFPGVDVDTAHALLVGFVHSHPSATAGEHLVALSTDRDLIHVHGRELYWLAYNPMSESTVSMPQLAKALGAPTTTRNITTLRKLSAKYCPAS